MNIREAAIHSGLPVKTVRYYDEIDLVKADRADNGYRVYGNNEIHKLKFLNRARGLGFSIEDCRQLLSLYEDQDRASADVKEIALANIASIEAKMRELETMRDTLAKLVQSCHGDERPDCPILDELQRFRPNHS